MGEPASIGTLLELGTCSLEILQHLTSKKPASLPPISTAVPTSYPLGFKIALIHSTRQTLETILVYASTQLVLWLSKHDVEQTGEMPDAEETQSASVGPGTDGHGYGYGGRADIGLGVGTGTKERRMRRKSQSLTLAERLRRGMTGEMTMDLQTLIVKAKASVASSSGTLGKPEPSDILVVLESFLEDRMMTSS